MKNLNLILITTLLLASCGLPRDTREKLVLKGAFKDQVFISSLIYLFGEDFREILAKQDMSPSNNMERLAPYYHSKADSLGKVFAIEINSLPEGYKIEGKRTIINFCLEYYKSKRLDHTVDSIFAIRK